MPHHLLHDDSRIFVTADSHFGQKDAATLYDRPFENEVAMNDAIIDRWNETLDSDDVLVHLGDFVGDLQDNALKIETATRIRDRLEVGRILLVRGNHDVRSRAYDDIFDDVVDLLDHRWSGSPHRVIMSHYPMRSWRGNRRGSVHLYGHTHGRIEEIGRSTDVGVDCWRLRPIHLATLVEEIARRPILAFPMRRMRRQPDRDGLSDEIGS